MRSLGDAADRDELGRVETVVGSQDGVETRTAHDYSCVVVEDGKITREARRSVH